MKHVWPRLNRNILLDGSILTITPESMENNSDEAKRAQSWELGGRMLDVNGAAVDLLMLPDVNSSPGGLKPFLPKGKARIRSMANICTWKGHQGAHWTTGMFKPFLPKGKARIPSVAKICMYLQGSSRCSLDNQSFNSPTIRVPGNV